MDLSHANISILIRQIVAEWMNKSGMKDINVFVQQGYCAELAEAVWRSLGQPANLEWKNCDDPCHTWLYFDGRHYDMLDPDGASTQAEMKEFSRVTHDELILLAKQKNGGVDKSWDRQALYALLGWA